MAGANTISAQLDEILGEAAKEEKEILDKSVAKAARQCKQDIVNASPEGPKGYKRSWAVKTKKTSHGIEAIVHNKDHYQLTHLLEKSHVIRNQYGTYGRTYEGHGQHVHIAPAAEKAEAYLMELLTSAHN